MKPSEYVQPLVDPEPPGATVGWFRVTHGIDVTTKAVFRDEPCWYLGEYNLPSKSGKSRSRYQLIRVVRNDRLETAWVYLGPARKFGDQFQMIGGYMENGRGYAVHTVAELQDGADEIRGRDPRREVEPTDLQGAFIQRAEQKKEVLRMAQRGALIA